MPQTEYSLQMVLSDERCSYSYISEFGRCVDHREKEHSSHVTSTIYIHSESNSHPHANISHFTVIDQNSKLVAREARETIHSRSETWHSVATQEKCTLQNSSADFLEKTGLLMGQSKWQTD